MANIIISFFGVNNDIDMAGIEDLVSGGGKQFFPVVAIPFEALVIVSDSANDTAAGTGARTIQIDGLGADFRQQSEIVTLNGLTPVASQKAWYRVFVIFARLVGSTQENEGTIIARDLSLNVIATILPDSGRSKQAAYTVPINLNNVSIQQVEIFFGQKQAGSALVKLRTRKLGESWNDRRDYSVSNFSPTIVALDKSIQLDPLEDVVMSVSEATANNIEISGGCNILAEQKT